jgi:hypothetical protein
MVMMARLVSPLAAKNLQSRETKPISNKPAAKAARAVRSTFGSAIRAFSFAQSDLFRFGPFVLRGNMLSKLNRRPKRDDGRTEILVLSDLPPSQLKMN